MEKINYKKQKEPKNCPNCNAKIDNSNMLLACVRCKKRGCLICFKITHDGAMCKDCKEKSQTN